MSDTLFERLSEHQQVQALGVLVLLLAQGAPEPMINLVDSLVAFAQDAATPTYGDVVYAHSVAVLADHLARTWAEENGASLEAAR